VSIKSRSLFQERKEAKQNKQTKTKKLVSTDTAFPMAFPI
jgi:hypothetical protein